MPHLALSAIGRDRPGIVAAVTRALLDQGVNVEDAEMAILRGRFAMTLVLAAPAGADLDALRAGLDAARDEVGLEALHLEPITDEGDHAQAAAPNAVVSVYGVDHPGIVHAVADALARAGASITDLSTRLVGTERTPVYSMLLEVAGPPPDALHELLAPVARAAGVELAVRPLEPDAL